MGLIVTLVMVSEQDHGFSKHIHSWLRKIGPFTSASHQHGHRPKPDPGADCLEWRTGGSKPSAGQAHMSRGAGDVPTSVFKLPCVSAPPRVSPKVPGCLVKLGGQEGPALVADAPENHGQSVPQSSP